MARDTLCGDVRAVSAVIGTVMTIVIAVAVSAGIWFVLDGIADNSGRSAPSIGIITERNGATQDAWKLRVQAVSQTTTIPDFLFVLDTPADGTLVAHPAADAGSISFLWSLDAGAGAQTAQTDPGLSGGYHLRYTDMNANGLFDAGDRLALYHDADGDGGHQEGPDDALPSGAYTLSLKHVSSEALVGSITRE